MAMDFDYDELFPGRFLKSGEFKDKDVTLKISGVQLEELPDKKGTKFNKEGERVRVRGIISFERTDKQLVLNRTNGECLKALFGRKTVAWIGKRVTFFPAVVDAFGEQTPAIRVRGSPDIDRPIKFAAQIGQKQVTVTLKRTGAAPAANGKPALAAAPAPAQQVPVDPDGLDGMPEDPPEESERVDFAP